MLNRVWNILKYSEYYLYKEAFIRDKNFSAEYILSGQAGKH